LNYFAHLFLSQPTVASTVGNLLGDFAKGVDRSLLPVDIAAGLDNHRAADRFTDTHTGVQSLKRCFKPSRRRFAGIALDIYFDHLLMKHFDLFSEHPLRQVVASFYQRMEQGRELMPSETMRRTTESMIRHDWFAAYADIDYLPMVLDRVAARIRFPNQFVNAIEDIRSHEQSIEQVFQAFFPQLISHISLLEVEVKSTAPPGNRGLL